MVWSYQMPVVQISASVVCCQICGVPDRVAPPRPAPTRPVGPRTPVCLRTSGPPLSTTVAWAWVVPSKQRPDCPEVKIIFGATQPELNQLPCSRVLLRFQSVKAHAEALCASQRLLGNDLRSAPPPPLRLANCLGPALSLPSHVSQLIGQTSQLVRAGFHHPYARLAN